MYTSTKYFHEIGPCAYRNVHSQTDCYLLHGYCRSFRFLFGASTLDKQGFVVDFGALKQIKSQLQDWFDHTVILQADDPIVPEFRSLEKRGHVRLRTFPLISSEGLAEYCARYVDDAIRDATKGRAHVINCEHIEAEKNSAIFTLTDDNRDEVTFADLVQYAKDVEADNNGDG